MFLSQSLNRILVYRRIFCFVDLIAKLIGDYKNNVDSDLDCFDWFYKYSKFRYINTHPPTLLKFKFTNIMYHDLVYVLDYGCLPIILLIFGRSKFRLPIFIESPTLAYKGVNFFNCFFKNSIRFRSKVLILHVLILRYAWKQQRFIRKNNFSYLLL